MEVLEWSSHGATHQLQNTPKDSDKEESEDDSPSEPILSSLQVEIPPNEEILIKAVRLNDHLMIGRLIRQNADINMKFSEGECMVKSRCLSRHIRMTQYTPLQVAALHSSMETMKLLTDNGADVNLCDGNNRSPLHYAAAAGRLDVVKHLLDKGAKVNHQTKSERTPLIEAISLQHLGIVRTLVKAGANVNLKDGKGTSPLHNATMFHFPNLKIAQCLIDAGCDVNITNQMQATPLMMCVGLRNVGFVKLLLDAGAEVNRLDHKNMSAFHLCVESERMEVPNLLIQRGADINSKDKMGLTPLAKAVKYGKFKFIRLLLTKDCERDPEILNSERMQQLCLLAPVFGEWFKSEMSETWTLLRCCRYRIRNTIPTEKLTDISSLPLPRTLIDYLQFVE